MKGHIGQVKQGLLASAKNGMKAGRTARNIANLTGEKTPIPPDEISQSHEPSDQRAQGSGTRLLALTYPGTLAAILHRLSLTSRQRTEVLGEEWPR